ncbi:hypothetical protein ACFC09_14690 [Streptomyces sp. NPDC056161]|uniref:hypothetical protein n=1 Tax=Streptomyces sp. NPDC056161 TaxID=3345732 RepID=UPI0035E0E1D4
MFEGVLLGLGLAVVKAAWETSHVHVEVDDQGDGPIRVRVLGNASVGADAPDRAWHTGKQRLA